MRRWEYALRVEGPQDQLRWFLMDRLVHNDETIWKDVGQFSDLEEAFRIMSIVRREAEHEATKENR